MTSTNIEKSLISLSKDPSSKKIFQSLMSRKRVTHRTDIKQLGVDVAFRDIVQFFQRLEGLKVGEMVGHKFH